MRKLVLALVLAVPVAGSSGEQVEGRKARAYPVAEVPASLAPGVQRAVGAIAALQARLSARLAEELRKGGPAQAASVCRDEAQALSAETARAEGIRVGRTSHRLRNPANAAPGWAEPFVKAGADQKAAAAEALAVDLGDRVGVLRPIPTMAACTQCHGSAQRLSPDVRRLLATSYPDDRAVGFEEGDLRGFIWAEAPRQAPETAP